MYPLVSVIVNCHNGAKYLETCIKSILNQKYENFEIIFFDNSSIDDSKKIIDKFHDNRIKYFYSDKKLSLYKARNEAIKQTSGNLIAFLDVDDWWDENYLSNKKKFLKEKKYDYFYSNVLLYYEKKNSYIKYNKFNLPEGKIFNYLADKYFVIISGLIIRKDLLVKENYFNENYNIIGDYDLVMRISKYANAKSFNETNIFYRVHKDNFSKLNNEMYYYEYKDWYDRQKKKNDNYFKINREKFLLELNKLDIINNLYKEKNLELFVKIIRFPKTISKFKYLLAFCLPLKIIKYFRK